MEKDLNTRVKKGISWNISNKIVSQLIFVWFGIYLARLLGPEVYGLVGMVTIFSGLASILVDFGFSSSIIYFQDLNKKDLSSVFWLNLALSILIYLIFYFCAPFLADFYNEPKVTFLTRLLSLNFIIYAFSALQNALFTKKIDFKKVIISSWIAVIISYLVAFLMAYNNYGVYSLVAQIIIHSFINTGLLWVFSNWRPSFYFSFKSINPIFKYGINIAGTNLLSYLTRNTDNLLIGKFLGDASLGIYTRSYSLMMLPITNISQVFTKVLFPAFSEMQTDLEGLRKYYLKTVKLIALVVFPLMFGLSSIAEEFVLLLLGDAWFQAVPVIRLLAILGAFQAILALNGTIYNSTGNANKGFKVTLILNVILIVGWSIGLFLYDLMGLVYSYVIIGTLGTLPILYNALKQIQLSLVEIYHTIKYPVFGGILILLINNSIDYFFDFKLTVRLFFKIPLSIFTYILILYLYQKSLLILLLSQIKNRL
ncbi:lipopolysaccharide biosynthesis protein [Antarcticibacterium flavum]|uniref:Lipopolysaccharide biosynthesis protein n=1 Tax=Antarcticibacterium flavum TaxID=2058175 RepID=A0A5B7WZX0_9FLAO|nr:MULTISPECIES: lipopolysaccharide biosynthesis protein [Antarcticibacterium]MCM4158776.1 hypothetical protein [Antarcticibacterium sp. W02-3]QCY68627.1 lipopolysaccharide biosynthesis protein [Antarcticibacterium flavum]